MGLACGLRYASDIEPGGSRMVDLGKHNLLLFAVIEILVIPKHSDRANPDHSRVSMTTARE